MSQLPAALAVNMTEYGWRTRSIPEDPSYVRSLDPDAGILIPSPTMSHSYAISPFPFDPENIFGRPLFYKPDHLISDAPAVLAGQAVVIEEMYKLKQAEVAYRKFQSLPEKEVKNIDPTNVKLRAVWRKKTNWTADPQFDL